jgi:hypothetical protein
LNYKNKTSRDAEKYNEEHKTFLEKQFAAGIFMAPYQRISEPDQVILAKAKSIEDIEVIIGMDPYKKYSLATYDIIEF